MAETLSAKNFVSCLSDYDKSVVECCVCRKPMSDPVLLKCLHSGCRSCLSVASNIGSSSAAVCPACCEATQNSAIMSNSFLRNYIRLSALTAQMLNCRTCYTESVTAAVFWCADCCTALCSNCCSWHNRFTRRHRCVELKIIRTWSVSQLTPHAQCLTHKQQCHAQCFTCREPKCLLCYECCRASQHELQPLSRDSTRKRIAAVVEAITSVRKKLCGHISCLQQKCRDTRSHLQVNYCKNDGHRWMLEQHKRSLLDATVNAFDTSVREVCANLERIWCMCTTFMAKFLAPSDIVSFSAQDIEVLSSERWARLGLLHKKRFLNCFANRNVSSFATLLRRRKKYWLDNGDFCIDGSAPLTSAIVLRSCLGTTEHSAAAPPAPLEFKQVSVTFRTPVNCYGLAVTRDGHVLLAAREHGLLVYSSRGHQLSSWRPARQSSGENDCVSCVAALSDGRAAVAVSKDQLILLLRRSEADDTWLEDRRVVVLQSPPFSLAVHGDLLAAVEYRRDEHRRLWAHGRQVKLLSLSSGRLLYTHSKDYDIWRVALTALCLVTVSYGQVKRNSGATPYVVDAFSHSGEFLWRHETSDKESVTGLCVSADTWHRVYVAVVRDRHSRVMAVSGSDGKDMRDVINSGTHSLLLPYLLSLARAEQWTVLAVLSRDRAAKQYRTVSLFKSKSSREQ